MSSQENDRTRARLLVVQPDPQDSLDRFSGLLTDSGVAVRVVQPFARETLPDRLEEDGLLVLGGRMSAVDDEQYPWLADVRRLLCHAVDLPRPALGICLGGQLLAQTFGGTVTAGDRGLEAGVVRIRWRPEARADALFANLPTPFLAGAMRDDMVKTLPEIAVWLGHSGMYPHQAFRVGPCAWGVQFHPEVSPAGYREWVSARAGTDPVALQRMGRGAADFQRLDDDVVAGISVLAKRFADLVRALSAGGPSGNHKDAGVHGREPETGPTFSPGPWAPGAGGARADEPVRTPGPKKRCEQGGCHARDHSH